jgi:hypothetical protein
MTRRIITGGRHDRISDIAFTGGSGRDRGVGGIFVSAEIIDVRPDELDFAFADT